MHYKLYAGIALAVLVVLFILQNMTVVDIRFLMWKLSMSRALLVFLILAIGIAIGWLMHDHYLHIKQDRE